MEPMRDLREMFVESHQMRKAPAALTPAALEDLKYFEKRAKEGAPIRLESLLDWLKQHHGMVMGRVVLYKLMTNAGLTPWWAQRR
jgi:hypothetical protein